MTTTAESAPLPGIDRRLARARARMLSALRYSLRLKISGDPAADIEGLVSITFELAAREWPHLDFAPVRGDIFNKRFISEVVVDGQPAAFSLQSGHLGISGVDATPGEHRLDIHFIAGKGALIRRSGLVYTLFVPARAHSVFPCFDQPDLKGRLRLELDLPSGWDALSNAPLAEISQSKAGQRLRFAESEPLPTYLFAFAAGRLERHRADVAGRTIDVLYAPAAAEAFARNRDELIVLHAHALRWLETYTAIPYPFAALGFVLIPDFDFGGMEHPGAVFYRQRYLLLDEDASLDDRLHRAALIGHETAHLWFGDFVTMPWFDDVWLKEVFASFMADKIVADQFPNADHDSAFVLRHFPPALAIDRTPGTHAIREPLENLAEAGELYDALIYHKAPIAIDALERSLGPDTIRSGLRDYLGRHAYGNADWPALMACLERASAGPLDDFDARWIRAAGAPILGPSIDPSRARAGAPEYGLRILDADAQQAALVTLATPQNGTSTVMAWLALYETMLAGGIAPARLVMAGADALAHTREASLRSRLLDDLHETFWRYLDSAQRAVAAGPLEKILCAHLVAEPTTAHVDALRRFALSPDAQALLESAWRDAGALAPRLPDSMAAGIALTLAMHRTDRADDLVTEQIARTRDENLKSRLEFLRPAFSIEPDARSAFFARLLRGDGRTLWAVEGLSWLNHPLRAAKAIDYLLPALERADELRRQGDIFAPRQWLTALFTGHASVAAANIVRAFIAEREHPQRFRRLLLLTADPVFRAARIRARS